MKRKISLITLGLVTTMIPLGLALAGPGGSQQLRPQLVPVPDHGPYRPLEVDVWTDAGDGAVLFPGEDVRVTLRTNQDAFVVLLNVDTRGRVRKLFPNGRDDGFVRGGERVRVPERHAGYRLQVTGPAGVERLVAVASDQPIAHHWRELADELLLSDARFDESQRGKARFSGFLLSGATRVELAKRAPVTERVQPTPTGPQLRRVPTGSHAGLAQAETWFRVGRRGRFIY